MVEGWFWVYKLEGEYKVRRGRLGESKEVKGKMLLWGWRVSEMGVKVFDN